MKQILKNQNGIALVIALILTLAIMAMATGVLYFINYSVTLSSAAKKYATAAEASDGAVDLMKDTINTTLYGEASAPAFASGNCLVTAITTQNSPCTATISNLPSTISGNYVATVTVTRLYTQSLPGGRLEFARSAGGAPSSAIYFRIVTLVTSPNDTTTAENSVLYRFTG